MKENEDKDSSVGCGCCVNQHPHLDEFFGNIAKASTAHGVKYIGSRKLHLYERVFWTIVMLTCFSVSIYQVVNIYSKYNANPMIISFQPEETSISRIPFPAITICNVNMLKTSVLFKEWDYLIEMVNKARETNNSVGDDFFGEAAHLNHLGQYCLQASNFRRHIHESLTDINGRKDFIDEVTEFLSGFSNNLTERLNQFDHNRTWRLEERMLFKNATMNCEEMLVQCMWAGELIPCKELFFPLETRNGRCCVFNMMPTFILQNISSEEGRAKHEMHNIPPETLLEWRDFVSNDLIIKEKDKEKLAKMKYPKHQKAGGKPFGLTVLLNPILHEYSTCTSNDGWGFKVVAHSPLSSPNVMEYGVGVPPRSEVFVDVEPHVTVADEELLGDISVKKRGCYLSTDKKAKLSKYSFYSPENCFSECLAENTYKNCLCVRYYMPRNSSQKLCGAKDKDCTDEVRTNLTQSMGKNGFCGHCLPACTEIKYKLQISHFDMREDKATSFFTYENPEGHPQNATDYTILHIFMGIDSLYAKERKTLYDWSDLMAKAGGLLSLTLGISIISLIEIGYFFTLGAGFQFCNVVKEKSSKSDNEDEKSQIFHRRKELNRRSSSTTSVVASKKNNEYYNWATTRNRFGITGGDPHATEQGKLRFMF